MLLIAPRLVALVWENGPALARIFPLPEGYFEEHCFDDSAVNSGCMKVLSFDTQRMRCQMKGVVMVGQIGAAFAEFADQR